MTKDSNSNIYSFDGIRDRDLHAYIDGQLDSQRMKEVEVYLEHNPEAAEKFRDYAACNDLMRRAYRDVATSPVPRHLLAVLSRPPARRRSVWMRTAAVVLLCLLSAGGGWIAAKQIAAAPENTVVRQQTAQNEAAVEKVPVRQTVPAVVTPEAQIIDISTQDGGAGALQEKQPPAVYSVPSVLKDAALLPKNNEVITNNAPGGTEQQVLIPATLPPDVLQAAPH